MRIFCALVLAVLGTNIASAETTTFRAEAEGDTIKIFSQSDEEKICTAWVYFSFIYEGERHHTFTTCPDRKIAISDDKEICRVTNAEIVEPKLESAVEFECEE